MKTWMLTRDDLAKVIAVDALYAACPELLPLQERARTLHREYLAAGASFCCGQHIKLLFPVLRLFMQTVADQPAIHPRLQAFLLQHLDKPPGRVVLHYRDAPRGPPLLITLASHG